MPDLPGSRAMLTSIRISQSGPGQPAVTVQLAQRRFARDRVDQAHVGHDRTNAARLQRADEVPLEQLLVVRGELGDEILRAVLPHEPDSGGGQRGKIVRVHVLGHREQFDRTWVSAGGGGCRCDLLAHLCKIGPNRVGAQAGDQLSHATPA